MQHKPTINLSGITEEQLDVPPAFLKFWTLQFGEGVTADIQIQYTPDALLVESIERKFSLDYDLMKVLHQISPLDVSYIEQLFESKDEQLEMIQLVRKELTINLDELVEAMTQNDSKQIKQAAHKLNSKLLVLSIPALDAVRFIEDHAEDAQCEAVQKEYHLFKMYCFIRLWQIQEI